MLGNGDTQDTDHYVEVDLMLKHEPFRAELHLLDLPVTFDVIVGLDWLDRHDGHAHARARTLEVTSPMGMRIILAGYGTVSLGLPRREDFESELNEATSALCFLGPISRGNCPHGASHDDLSEIDIIYRRRQICGL